MDASLRLGRASLLVVTFLGLTQMQLARQPQQTTSKSLAKNMHRTGSVSGKVFLITRGGDLKVARLAKVYLLWSGDLSPTSDSGDSGQTPAVRYLKEFTEGLRGLTEHIKDIPAESYSERLECLKQLHLHSSVLLRVLESAATEKRPSQALVQHTDEEQGSFKFDGVRPGFYILLAEGQAGTNRAYWGEENIKLLPGQAIVVKLSSPAESCLVTEE